MLHLILIILIIIGTLGVATYGGVTLLQATQNMSDTQTNLRRLENVAWALRNSGGVYSSTYNTYVGRDLRALYTSYTIPNPTLFATPSTVSGINFHYCPYKVSLGAGSNVYVNLPGTSNNYVISYGNWFTGTSFQAIVLRGVSAVGTSYLADTDAPVESLHVVTMPSAGKALPPLCDTLTTTNGMTTVPGGRVAAVTMKQILNSSIRNTSKFMNLYVATAASGDGTGRDVSNAMTLNQAMLLWRTIQPRITVMNLAAGTYTADGTNTFPASSGFNAGNPLGTKLTWVGASKAGTIIDFSGSVTVDLPVDLSLQSLTFGTTSTTIYERQGGTLMLNDVALTANYLYLKGGTTRAIGTASTISSPHSMEISVPAILSLSAPLTFTSTSDTVGIQIYGGTIKGGGNNTNGTLTVEVPNSGTGIRIVSGMISSNWDISITGSPDTGILVMPAGQLYAHANIYVYDSPGVGVNVAGMFTLDNAKLLVPDGATIGVQLISGGEFYLRNGGEIGSAIQRPSRGVRDSGGTKIGGGNGTTAKIYATTTCWDGTATPNLFSSSQEGNGLTSVSRAGISDGGAGNYDYLLIDNRSSWLCTR